MTGPMDLIFSSRVNERLLALRLMTGFGGVLNEDWKLLPESQKAFVELIVKISGQFGYMEWEHFISNLYDTVPEMDVAAIALIGQVASYAAFQKAGEVYGAQTQSRKN